MKIKLVSLTKDGNLIVDNKGLQKVVITKDDMDKIKYKPIVYNKNQQFLNYKDRYSVTKYNYEFAVGVIKEAYIEDNEVFVEVEFFDSFRNNLDLDHSKITKCDNFFVTINERKDKYKIDEFISAEVFLIPKRESINYNDFTLADEDGNIIFEGKALEKEIRN